MVSESLIPATHTKAAAPAKRSNSIGKDNDANMLLAIPRWCLQENHAHLYPLAVNQQGVVRHVYSSQVEAGTSKRHLRPYALYDSGRAPMPS